MKSHYMRTSKNGVKHKVRYGGKTGAQILGTRKPKARTNTLLKPKKRADTKRTPGKRKDTHTAGKKSFLGALS